MRWLWPVFQKITDAKFGFGYTTFRVMRILGCDVNPFMHDDPGYSYGHQFVALFAAAADALQSKHLAEACAVYVHEWLDVSIVDKNPAQRLRLPWRILAERAGLRNRRGFAFSVEVDG